MANSGYCSSVVVSEPLKRHASPYTLEHNEKAVYMRWILEISHGVGSEKISGELELEIKVMYGWRCRMKVTDKDGVLTRTRDCIPLLWRGQVDFIDVFLKFHLFEDVTLEFSRLTWGTGNVLSTGNLQYIPGLDVCFLIAGSICEAESEGAMDVRFQASIFLSSDGENSTAETDIGEETSESDESEEEAENVGTPESEEMEEISRSEESEEDSDSEQSEEASELEKPSICLEE